MKKYYRVLEVAYDAPFDEVKQAYRDLVRVWHPDRFVRNERMQKVATAKLTAINEAYSFIRSMHVNLSEANDSTECSDLIDWSIRTASMLSPSAVTPVQQRNKQTKPWRWHSGIFPTIILALLLGIPSLSNTGESQHGAKSSAQFESANAAFAHLLGFRAPSDELSFTVGSTREVVVSIQGQPTAEILKYGESYVTIENNRVTSWSVSSLHPLFVHQKTDTSR